MASLKADKPVGTQLFGQTKKEAVPKASDGAPKGPSKSASKKATQKSQESKKKGKGSKAAAKH